MASIRIEGDSTIVEVSGEVASEVQQVAEVLSSKSHRSQRKAIDLVDGFVSRAKSHPIVAFLLIASLIVVGLANFTESLGRLASFATGLHGTPKLSALPGETGWIFAGYYDSNTMAFTEGPYVSVTSSPSTGYRDRHLKIGDQIALNVKRKVIVLDFATNGSARNLESPITAGIVAAKDETGLTLPKNAQLIVRDISEGAWPHNPVAALWLRVVERPE